MIKNMKKYGYIAFVLCVLAGCASQKQISYLQDVPDDYRQKITQDYDLRIHPDDLLSIMVNSKDICASSGSLLFGVFAFHYGEQ